ncbi:hypothetical protein HK102_005357 [Quaeritorhiza haematococci]|nr:hypothetical protein HK102_005357 [Quaeritorhiza haematococci]
MKSYIRFAAPTYCLPGLQNWTCVTCINGTEGTENVTTFGDFDNGIFGYVARHESRKLLIVAFRGTRNVPNWINNLMAAKPDCPFPGAPEGTKIHLGFLRDWESVRSEVMQALTPLLLFYEDYSVLFVGHSLGGALATLAAVDIVGEIPDLLDPTSVILTTVAQPRVGNSIWANWVASKPFKRSWRIVNQNDFTPHLPPALSGFQHHPAEVWIADGDGDTYYCGDHPQDGKGISVDMDGEHDVPHTEEESPNCSNGVRGGYAIERHQWAWDVRVGHKACLVDSDGGDGWIPHWGHGPTFVMQDHDGDSDELPLN